MTRDEILAMEPGRELDDLVMKTIFNARKGYYGEESVWYHYDESGEPDYEWSCYNRPSTDISAAWEVVEKLQEHHLYVDIRTCADFYEVWITRWETGEVTSTVAYPKLPEAICKAALVAVLEDPNEQ